MIKPTLQSISWLSAALLLALAAVVHASEPVLLAEKGKALLPIIIAPQAASETRAAAEELAEILEQITGATFPIITEEEPTDGIVVGTTNDFPLYAVAPFEGEHPWRREDYLFRTNERSCSLIGATPYAVSHAVWDLLHQAGVRQYFPGPLWEIIPKLERLSIQADRFEQPDYIVRSIWPGFGTWAENRAPFHQWERRNRMSRGAYELRSGHVYGAIIAKYREEFDNTPELLSQVDGKPTLKFNAAHPRTLELILEAKRAEVEAAGQKGKRIDSVSMDPSDGGGWGNSEGERAIGNPSDRVVYLANAVARTLREEYGPIAVGIYAYNEHAAAPARQKVDRAVIVSFATAFIKGDKTLEENMAEWREVGVRQFGIREYYSVYPWDRDFPGRARASQFDYITKTIPDFHTRGARFMSAEAGDNWGAAGLGYYLASALLWDCTLQRSREDLVEEFIRHCFPHAEAPMRRLYLEFLFPPQGRRIEQTPDLFGRMFRLLKEARSLARDEATQARITALLLYTQHLVNQYNYQHTKNGESLERLLKHSWRMRHTQMVHSLAVWRAEQGKAKLAIPEECKWKVPEGKNPWKSSAPFTEDELATMLEQGVKNHPVFEIAPVAYSRELVPATQLPHLRADEGKPVEFLFRGQVPIYTEVSAPEELLEFTATPGVIYTNMGAARLELFESREEQGQNEEHSAHAPPLFEGPVASLQLPPDQQPHPVQLKARRSGTHIMQLSDRRIGTKIQWPARQRFTLEFSPATAPNLHRYNLLFYVPRGTQTIAALARGGGKIFGPDGELRFELTGKEEYISVPTRGDTAKCWRFEGIGGQLRFLTIPPFMAPSVTQLLLPKEVVEADQP